MISHYINSDHSFLYLSTIKWIRTLYATHKLGHRSFFHEIQNVLTSVKSHTFMSG